jgi:ribosome biogenesis GTPase
VRACLCEPARRQVSTQTGHFLNEITALSKNCKYVDCTHTHELSCAVLNAIKSNELDENKYLNFVKLKKEAEYYGRTELEKRKKDHQ